MEKKARVLIVEDCAIQLADFASTLKKAGFDVECAMTIAEANDIVADSLRKDKLFDVAFIDLNVGSESGGEFGRRLLEIIPSVNVVIVTAYPDPAGLLPYVPDDALIKPIGPKALLEIAQRMIKPRRLRINDYEDALNHWKMTEKLVGFNDLKFHSRTLNPQTEGYVEKITSKASDGEFINTVIYCDNGVSGNIINVALSSLLGCPCRCAFCKNWRNRVDDQGLPVAFKRPLTEGEIAGQVLIALNSPRVREALRNGSGKKIIFRYTCEGDALVHNMSNCGQVFQRLSAIENPEVGFNFTSVGSVTGLKKYISRFIKLPRTSHYWSVDTLNKQKRKWLKPGVSSKSLKEMRDLYAYIATATNHLVTVSWVLIKGFNDQPEDIKMIAEFFQGQPFEFKLMAPVKDSLSGVEETTKDDLELFKQKLEKVGIPTRIRNILGSEIAAGCGNTIIPWLRSS